MAHLLWRHWISKPVVRLAGIVGYVDTARWPFLFGCWAAQRSYFSTDLTFRYFEVWARARLIRDAITHTQYFLFWIKAAKTMKSVLFFHLSGGYKSIQLTKRTPHLICSAKNSENPIIKSLSGPLWHLHCGVWGCGVVWYMLYHHSAKVQGTDLQWANSSKSGVRLDSQTRSFTATGQTTPSHSMIRRCA